MEVSKPNLSEFRPIEIPNFILSPDPNDLSCKQFSLNGLTGKKGLSFDTRLNYRIIFQHDQEASVFQLQLIEENQTLAVDDVMKPVYPKPVLIDKQKNIFKSSADYIPSPSAEDVGLRFCLTPTVEEPLPVEISDIAIYAFPAKPEIFASLDDNLVELSTPRIEFVGLNQTKYLVRIKGSNDFILNFNSRYDKGWSLREVDYETANQYFIGKTKEYFQGNVVEYEMGDKHIITDLVFPNYSRNLKLGFKLNGFSNGWIIGQPNNKSKEKVDEEDSERARIYLLEYENQNDLYKAVAVSFISLILVLTLLFIKYIKIR